MWVYHEIGFARALIDGIYSLFLSRGDGFILEDETASKALPLRLTKSRLPTDDLCEEKDKHLEWSP